MIRRRTWVLALLCLCTLLGLALFAQQTRGQYPDNLLAGLQWRDVGPLRGGRTYGVSGHADQPDTFYFGSVGGATWKKILFKTDDAENVGAIDLAIDPKNPRVVYASLWATRRPPWSVYAPSNMPGGGLYKSTDGGDTWKQLTGGLPNDQFVG